MNDTDKLIKILKDMNKESSYNGCIGTLQELQDKYNKLIKLMEDNNERLY